ncbi:Fatty acyl-CoA synthetase and RNA processing-associated kinase 1 [Botrytis cinerea]
MSSAALQTAPHQPTSIGSQSPVAAPSSSGRPYTSGSQQSRDPYYNQSTTNASPSSARKPSRRPSGNGASTNTPPQPQYTSPLVTTTTTAPVNSRTNNPSTQISPTTATSPSSFAPMAPGDHQRGVPPIVSERSSSNRPSTAVAAATSATNRSSSSRRGEHPDEQRARDAPRRAQSQENQYHERRNIQTNGTSHEDATAAATAATRARRRAQQSPEALPHRPSGGREQRAGPPSNAQNRSHPAGTTSPAGLSHEASEVLNRVVVSDPKVDMERERERMAEAVPSAVAAPPVVEEAPRQQRSRHDHSANSGKREKNSKFGEYYLGNTLGEGEFGKVKMGWKQAGGTQVAIKLIRRDSVGTNPTRLAKIYREIAILREISHPNIVQLHEMVETESKLDNAARRLFAQLVSGVGYLHKKGIVHRDLKLENLLLDRNRNIIITDFGFANTFNPDDELGDEIEYNLASRDYVKRMELDKILPGGSRRGDLMQTSCGSPCYAAPELVVSDSLYTGRKVDVWSCGVILYAMLAGYLPFDDDPANPEGDNINLLYKYIVSTPLTFPEYVTPHARDLLRRILVPDPRKRADLFEVARHSWLSEYAHVVGFITSSTTTTVEIANTTVPSDEPQEAPILARSASVREPKSQKAPAAVGDLSRKHGHVDQDGEEAPPKTSKDNKRRTVQVEYVAPRSQTQRGEPSTNSSGAQSGSRTRARAGSQGPVEISGAPQGSRRNVPAGERQSSQDPSMTREAQNAASARRTGSSQRQQGMVPPPRPTRDHRAASDINHTTSVTGQPSIARPTTGGSYSQPVAPTVAGTNAHGRMSQPQPKSSNSYNISPPMIQGEQTFEYPPQSTSQPIAPKFARVAGLPAGTANVPSEGSKTHKRSNTIGGIFSRTNSLFGGKSHAEKSSEKPKKSYPPVSMSNANVINTDDSRQSIDSRRSISFGFGSQEKASRRFSLLPASFSLKSIGIGKDPNTPPASTPTDGHYEPYPEMQGDHLDVSQDNRNVSGSTAEYQHADMTYDQNRASPSQQERQRFAQPQQQNPDSRMGGPPQFLPPANFRQDESALTTDSESSFGQSRRGPYQNENNNSYEDSRRPAGRNNGRGVLQKNNRKFADAYDQEHAHNDHGGSSGAARKVMDFFRRRGKARGE